MWYLKASSPLLTLGAKEHGIGGLVIYGRVRDADDIEQLDFPIFCRDLSILGTGKDGAVELNKTITIGKTTIKPGDIRIGDRDGVVVVPQHRIEEAIEKSIAREEKEENARKQLRVGIRF